MNEKIKSGRITFKTASGWLPGAESAEAIALVAFMGAGKTGSPGIDWSG
ncbi:MAG: hypothetical protein M0Z81_01985 [Deltaproteobacteria bacterium]|jgi:hypothetical protein|nr:hypothetical protein [Deltaproteobacteria bacterium]